MLTFLEWYNIFEGELHQTVYDLAAQGLNSTEIHKELEKIGIVTSVANIKYIIQHSVLPDELAKKRKHKATKSSEEIILKIYQLSKQGMSPSQIATELNLTERSVYRILSNPQTYPVPLGFTATPPRAKGRPKGSTKKPKPVSEPKSNQDSDYFIGKETMHKVIELNNAGINIHGIADQLGIDHKTVYRILQNATDAESRYYVPGATPVLLSDKQGMVVKLHKQGLSTKEIALETGLNHRTVIRILTKDNHDMVVNLYQQGLSPREIALKIKLDYRTVKSILKL